MYSPVKMKWCGQMSRELDALVAEKVFGQFIHHIKESPVQGSICDPIPHYSTSIQDAWLVVEKLDWDIVLDYVVMHGWKVVIKRPDLFQGYGEADTAPEAICRSALEARK